MSEPPTPPPEPDPANCCCKMKVNYFLGFGIVLAVVGATFLVAFGVVYIKPYMLVHGMRETRCTSAADFLAPPVHCMCSGVGVSQCVSSYPCYKIWVNFTMATGDVIDNITLYDSYDTYLLLSEKQQCSYHKCSRSASENLDAVKDFHEKYGLLGTSYNCYYDPEDTNYAILHVVTLTTVIHCIVWPALALISGFVILIIFLNNPREAKHHGFNSLERPWARPQTRYECIIDPQKGIVPVQRKSHGKAHSGPAAHGEACESEHDITTPTAQLV